MSGGLVAKLWADFSRPIVRVAPSALEVEAMRRVFYAGAGSLFWAITERLEAGPEREPTEEDFALIAAIKRELEESLLEISRPVGHS